MPMILLGVCASVPDFQEVLKTYEEADVAVVSYLSIFARLLLAENLSRGAISAGPGAPINVLTESLGATARDINSLISAKGGGSDDLLSSTHDLLCRVLKLMLSLFDSVNYRPGGVWHRKLWCLSLLSLYPSADPQLLEIFHEVVHVCEDVLSDEVDELADGDTTSAAGRESMLNKRAHRFAKALVGDSTDASDDDLYVYNDDDDGDGDKDGAIIISAANETGEPETENDCVVDNMAVALLCDVVTTTSVRAATADVLNKMSVAIPREALEAIVNQIGQDTLAKFS